MRFGIDTQSVVPGRTGGGETYLASLVEGLAAARRPGETLVLYVTRRNRRIFPPAGSGIEVVRLPFAHRSRALRLAVQHLVLPGLLALRPVDVLFSPGNALPPLAGVRHVLAIQSMHYRHVAEEMAPERVHYFRRMVPLSARRAARVVCVSEDLRRDFAEVAPAAAARAVVIHEGVDRAVFTPDGPAESGDAFLLFVSSLNRFKRPDRIVEALALLRDAGFTPPPVRMVGRPDPADRMRVEALASALGVEDLVRIEGVRPPEDLARLYRGARALVHPSVVETFGLPPIEAMACGCPVVAADRTSVPEVCGDGALLVDPDDVPALATAVKRVVTEEGLREDLVSRGFRNAARFGWGRAAQATLEVLREAAEGSFPDRPHSTRGDGRVRRASSDRCGGRRCTSSA